MDEKDMRENQGSEGKVKNKTEEGSTEGSASNQANEMTDPPQQLNNQEQGTENIKEETQFDNSESVSLQPKDKKSKKTKYLIAGIVTVILLVCIGIGTKFYLDDKAHKEYVQEYNDYLKLVKTTQLEMLSGAAISEEIGNDVKSVWSNAIWKKADDKTDKFTKVDGVFVDDFNIAINQYYSDLDVMSKIDDIKENQETVAEEIAELKKVPEGLEEHKEVIMDMYDSYLEMTDLVVSPSGSLKSFQEKFSSIDSEVMVKYKKVERLDFTEIQ